MKSLKEENKERLKADEQEIKIHQEKLKKIYQYFWIPGIILAISTVLFIVGAILNYVPIIIIGGAAFVVAFAIALVIAYYCDKENEIISKCQANIFLGALTGLMILCIESENKQNIETKNPPS